MATYSTSAECFAYATGSNVAPSTSTRPTLVAIDAFRDRVYAKIYRFTQTATDSNGVAKGIEMDLVKVMIDNIINNTNFIPQLTDDMINELTFEFSTVPIDSWEPNLDGSLTG